MNRIKIRNKIFASLVLTVFLLNHVAMAWAAGVLNINFIAVNASDQAQEMEIKQLLPKELESEDVVDSGPFKVEYDLDKKVYYAKGTINFQPKESKTFKIKVNDVWSITAEEIDLLRKQLDQNLQTMKDHENYGAAREAQEFMNKQLDYILAQQQNYSENIERRIEEFRSYKQTLEEMRNNIYSMDYLRFESKALKEMRDINKTVKFVIEVKNPSSTEERKITQKHYLPDEVRAEHIMDKKDFDVRFDEDKNRSYLTKMETFAPGETKKYEIVIKDIWQFPIIKLQDLDDRSQIAQGELAGTIYEESAQYLIDKIAKQMEEIKKTQSQAAVMSVENHIGTFRANQRRFDEAWSDFKRIEEMISIVRAKKLEQMEKGKVKNVLNRLKALRGLQQLSEALLKKTLSITVTWKIIMGTIIFIALFTTMHFVIWAGRSKKQGEEMGPKGGEGIKVVPKPGQQPAKET